MSDYEREKLRVESIVAAVIDDLSGRDAAHQEILDGEPSRKLCIGVLTPMAVDAEGDALKWRKKRQPDSLGFDARVECDDEGIIAGTADVTFALYHRVVPTRDEQRAIMSGETKQRLRQKYRRTKLTVSGLPFRVSTAEAGSVQLADTVSADAALQAACDERARTVRVGDPDYWPSGSDIVVDAAALEDDDQFREAAFRGRVPETVAWRGRLQVQCTSASDGLRLSALLVNFSSPSAIHPVEFFNVQFEVELNRGRYVSKDFAAALLDYRYETRTWGRGVNAVLEIDRSDCRRAIANTTPLFWQPRMDTKDVGDAASPSLLSGDKMFDSLGIIYARLVDYGTHWKHFIEQHPDSRVAALSSSDLDKFREEVKAFRLGVDALHADARLRTAFQRMNETAASKTEINNWRLFQIVFIVSMLPSLLARENADLRWRRELDIAHVLWFSTGGGKTEAYFAVILVAMFYDRLRGKKLGTTAWLRYPLRMLSIQQLQRLVEFVVLAEKVRLQYAKTEGEEPFTVGYYVGSSNTPNFLTTARGTHPIKKLKSQPGKAASLRVLQRCPFCFSPDVVVDVVDDIRQVRIIHRCSTCEKQAPIFISDAEIYRYLPTVLAGTVDRLARAGEEPLFAHIFGQVDQQCPQHGYASFRECVESGCGLTKSRFTAAPVIHDPTPALLIQDELHLLKESLGTYDSHFEGFLDEFARSVGTHLPPKRIAATATIEGYDRHVRQLYNREARRFPSKGIDLENTAYAVRSVEAPFGRLYCGILPFGLTTDQVAARVARALDKVASRAWDMSPDDVGFNGNYDLSLIYVNLKDSVGNIGDELRSLYVRMLSGEKSLDEVREAIDIVYADVLRPYVERVKAFIATSIISHGMDLERLNVMAFSGFPGRAADYIQASSRVGRRHLGVVFTAFNSANNLDRSTYAHFYEYHERLYQLVQPVPVNKFSQAAVGRTFTGIFSAVLLNILGRSAKRNFKKGSTVVEAFANGTLSNAPIAKVVTSAYGIDGLEDVEMKANYESLVTKKVAKANEDIFAGEDWATINRLSPRPVSSLRDVQEQIEFRADFTKIRTIEAVQRGRS